MSLNEIRSNTLCRRQSQHALGRHDHQGLAEITFELSAQNMKELCGCRWIDSFKIIARCHLQKALESCGGMLWSLAFITVRQKQNESSGTVPFHFSAGHKLIEDHLSAVGKIAELRLPDHECIGISLGISQLKSHNCIFRQRTIANFKFPKSFKWIESAASVLRNHNSVSMAESSALNVLSADTNGRAIQKQCSICKKFCCCPVDLCIGVNVGATSNRSSDRSMRRDVIWNC